MHNKNAPKSKCKQRRGVESENEEISEIARNRKTNIIKRKIRGGKKGIVRSKFKQEEENKKRIRNGKTGKNIDM